MAFLRLAGANGSAVQVSRLLEAAAARRSDLGDAAGSDLRSKTLAEIIGLSLTRGGLTVSGLLRPRFWRLDFFAKASRDLVRQAASLLVERSAAQAQGMSSSRREAGHRLTSLVSTSVK